MSRRPQPPYARQHREALADPAVSVWIAMGRNAWKIARNHLGDYTHGRPQVWLPLPDDTEPDAIDWRCCRGHDPVLLMPAGAVEGEQVRALIGALFRDGVERVLTPGQEQGLLYYKEVVYV